MFHDVPKSNTDWGSHINNHRQSCVSANTMFPTLTDRQKSCPTLDWFVDLCVFHHHHMFYVFNRDSIAFQSFYIQNLKIDDLIKIDNADIKYLFIFHYVPK